MNRRGAPRRPEIAAAAVLLVHALLGGCAGHRERATPPARPVPPAAAAQVPDAVPKSEPRSALGNPAFYDAAGKRYIVLASAAGYVERGVASWYGPDFHGKRTASGERYDMNAMTAAHKTMPLPSYALVRNPANGRQVVVKVNDRGPFVKGRIIDLSRAAARRLGIGGVAPVEVRRLTHDEIASGAWKLPVQQVAKSP